MIRQPDYSVLSAGEWGAGIVVRSRQICSVEKPDLSPSCAGLGTRLTVSLRAASAVRRGYQGR